MLSPVNIENLLAIPCKVVLRVPVLRADHAMSFAKIQAASTNKSPGKLMETSRSLDNRTCFVNLVAF